MGRSISTTALAAGLLAVAGCTQTPEGAGGPAASNAVLPGEPGPAVNAGLQLIEFDVQAAQPGQAAPPPPHQARIEGRLRLDGRCPALEAGTRVSALAFRRGSARIEAGALVVEGRRYAHGDRIAFGGPFGAAAILPADAAGRCGMGPPLAVNPGSFAPAG
jgi:hypothetical protein